MEPVADRGLPPAQLERLNFFDDVSPGRQDEGPGQLCRGDRWPGAGAADEDAVFGASLKVDMGGVIACLSHHDETVEPLDRGPGQRRPLLRQDDDVEASQALRQFERIFDRVREGDDFVPLEAGVASQCFKHLLEVVQNRDLHRRWPRCATPVGSVNLAGSIMLLRLAIERVVGAIFIGTDLQRTRLFGSDCLTSPWAEITLADLVVVLRRYLFA